MMDSSLTAPKFTGCRTGTFDPQPFPCGAAGGRAQQQRVCNPVSHSLSDLKLCNTHALSGHWNYRIEFWSTAICLLRKSWETTTNYTCECRWWWLSCMASPRNDTAVSNGHQRGELFSTSPPRALLHWPFTPHSPLGPISLHNDPA